MKRLFLVVALVCATIGSASAQKKDVLALTEELNTLKTQLAELTAVAESNKVLAEQLQTMVAAYENLENAYKSNSELITKLVAKIDELISTTEAATEAVKPEYEVVGNIHCGLAVIQKGVNYGFANAKGEVVIAPQYEEVEAFDRNLAKVRLNDKWGVIDTTGKVIIDMQCDELYNFDNLNIAKFRINGKFGLVYNNGKVFAAAQYDGIWSFSDGGKYYNAGKDGYSYRLYLDGRVVKVDNVGATEPVETCY